MNHEHNTYSKSASILPTSESQYFISSFEILE